MRMYISCSLLHYSIRFYSKRLVSHAGLTLDEPGIQHLYKSLIAKFCSAKAMNNVEYGMHDVDWTTTDPGI